MMLIKGSRGGTDRKTSLRWAYINEIMTRNPSRNKRNTINFLLHNDSLNRALY